MNIKAYTDDNYVPIKDLMVHGQAIVTEIEDYRRSFVEVISLNGLDFVNIVETPSLLKKRYVKNVELKGVLDIQAKDNDYILEIAKALVQKQDVKGIDFKEKEALINKFNENGKDLTIVTNYLANNIEKLVSIATSGDLEHIFPGLSRADVDFIGKYNNTNHNYSIQDYQEINSCSYETGRKALEKLEALKLYIKTKVGKKFVYQPTNKLIIALKGGN